MNHDVDSSPVTGRATPDDDLESLRAVTAGLLYPSESDAPVVPFRWPPVTGSASPKAEVIRRMPGVDVEQVPWHTFFDALNATSDAARFAELRHALELRLMDNAVFRIGNVDVTIIVIGRARDGSWVGVQTTSVET